MGEHDLLHSYFEKAMKNETLVVERTAMGRQSILSIMTNKLVRRLQVLDESLDMKETLEIIDKNVQQLCNSEFNWKQTRNNVVSAIKGYKRKEMIRKSKNRTRYRNLKARVYKKLTEKCNWFKKRKDSESDSNNEKEERKAETFGKKNWDIHRK